MDEGLRLLRTASMVSSMSKEELNPLIVTIFEIKVSQNDNFIMARKSSNKTYFRMSLIVYFGIKEDSEKKLYK